MPATSICVNFSKEIHPVVVSPDEDANTDSGTVLDGYDICEIGRGDLYNLNIITALILLFVSVLFGFCF